MIISLFIVLMNILSVYSDTDGWIAVPEMSKRFGKLIDFDMENTPLALKTDSVINSGDAVTITFNRQVSATYEMIGVLNIKFEDKLTYNLANCDPFGTYHDFDSNPPQPSGADKNLLWRITVDRTSGVRIIIHCNNKEVANVPIGVSGTRCTASTTNQQQWGKQINKIEFDPGDTASDYYRPYAEPKCEAPTITDGTVSPSTAISTGISYTVTCNGGFIMKGSKDISCENVAGKAVLATSPTCEKDDKAQLSLAISDKVSTALLIVLTTALMLWIF